MAIITQFTTAGDFWAEMLEPDYKAQAGAPDSLRAALHSAISLFHMSDWVFHTHESKVRAAFPIRCKTKYPESDFADALELGNQDFGRMRGICHAAKHLKLKHIRPVPGAPSRSANTRVQATGYGEGPYGVGPYGGPPRVVLEGADANDLVFADIAKSVRTMWVELNAVHGWW